MNSQQHSQVGVWGISFFSISSQRRKEEALESNSSKFCLTCPSILCCPPTACLCPKGSPNGTTVCWISWNLQVCGGFFLACACGQSGLRWSKFGAIKVLRKKICTGGRSLAAVPLCHVWYEEVLTASWIRPVYMLTSAHALTHTRMNASFSRRAPLLVCHLSRRLSVFVMNLLSGWCADGW